MSPTNEEFLQAAFGADWERAHVCAHPFDPKTAPPGAWAGGPVSRLGGQFQAEANTYYTISTFRPDENDNPRRKGDLTYPSASASEH